MATILIDKNVMVPMRDGVRLATDVYRLDGLNAGDGKKGRSHGILEDAVGALSDKLTQEEVAYLEEPYVPHPIVGHE